jgi:hypothetical protein
MHRYIAHIIGASVPCMMARLDYAIDRLGLTTLSAIPIGSEVPFVIRPTEEADHYRFVGECYIHSIMQGEFCG